MGAKEKKVEKIAILKLYTAKIYISGFGKSKKLAKAIAAKQVWETLESKNQEFRNLTLDETVRLFIHILIYVKTLQFENEVLFLFLTLYTQNKPTIVI